MQMTSVQSKRPAVTRKSLNHQDALTGLSQITHHGVIAVVWTGSHYHDEYCNEKDVAGLCHAIRRTLDPGCTEYLGDDITEFSEAQLRRVALITLLTGEAKDCHITTKDVCTLIRNGELDNRNELSGQWMNRLGLPWKIHMLLPDKPGMLFDVYWATSERGVRQYFD